MLYHYTSFDALGKILLEKPEKGKEICFRATRYECFEDQSEFRYGIDRTQELMDEIEKGEFVQKYKLSPDYFIAQHFESNIILSNDNIPKPFVISFTDSPTSKKMWHEYGHDGDGVVMGFNFDTKSIEQTMKAGGQSIARLDKCQYYTPKHHEEIKELLTKCYFEGAYQILRMAPPPIISMQFIWANILCSFCARIKDGKKYKEERETRIILNIPGNEWVSSLKRMANILRMSPLSLYDSLRRQFNQNDTIPERMEETLEYIQNIKSYYKADKKIFFKDFFLPIETLACLWVKKRDVDTVQALLIERGYSIPVQKVKTSLLG